jgi:hypothetical protein
VAFDRPAGVGVQRGWARPNPRFSPDTIDRVAWILAAVGSPDDSERSERPLDGSNTSCALLEISG